MKIRVEKSKHKNRKTGSILPFCTVKLDPQALRKKKGSISPSFWSEKRPKKKKKKKGSISPCFYHKIPKKNSEASYAPVLVLPKVG